MHMRICPSRLRRSGSCRVAKLRTGGVLHGCSPETGCMTFRRSYPSAGTPKCQRITRCARVSVLGSATAPSASVRLAKDRCGGKAGMPGPARSVFDSDFRPLGAPGTWAACKTAPKRVLWVSRKLARNFHEYGDRTETLVRNGFAGRRVLPLNAPVRGGTY